ncbi:hypothetical protein C7S16_3256 [Burkholderia thailandensis]|uniref:Uncharacterized protein n=1 Tax=Burkholderia thailandensis TaxID=57975 RepID=A0AAW9D1U7_BURTH|nr:hypothetical protein [Burkholderia thailandensis]MDW9255448.1 hypothetical protein [Burkholderia thailandensis]
MRTRVPRDSSAGIPARRAQRNPPFAASRIRRHPMRCTPNVARRIRRVPRRAPRNPVTARRTDVSSRALRDPSRAACLALRIPHFAFRISHFAFRTQRVTPATHLIHDHRLCSHCANMKNP